MCTLFTSQALTVKYFSDEQAKHLRIFNTQTMWSSCSAQLFREKCESDADKGF